MSQAQEMTAKLVAQAKLLANSPTHAFSTDPIEACAQTLVEEFAPAGLERVWFISGGSEATENAVKIALQYQRDRGMGTKQLVIGRWQSFHGATLASLGYGGNAGRRKKYQGMLPAGLGNGVTDISVMSQRCNIRRLRSAC